MPATPQQVTTRWLLTPGLVLPLALLGCAGDTGEVSLLVEPEGTIIDGLSAGDGLEEIQDGWSVHFSKYIVALGPIQLRNVQSGVLAFDAGRWAIDLAGLPARGTTLWTLPDVDSGRTDLFFATAASDLERHDSVLESDFEMLVDDGATHLIEGTLTHPTGASCPPTSLAEVPDDAEATGENAGGDACYPRTSVDFSIMVTAEVTYGPCSIDGVPGLSVESGVTTTGAISMHGDHLFFGGFPEGAEGEVRRYAQWLADCDLDLDGVVTSAELERIAPADLPEFDERFPLGGSPLRPVDDLLTYVRSQLSTQGHFQGEGECGIGFEALESP